MTYNPSLYRIHYLERLPQGTLYPAVVEAIRRVVRQLPRGTELVVDYTGVGKGVYDFLVDHGLRPIGVTMTGGTETHRNGDTVTVPKSTLVSKLLARVHSGELVVRRDIPGWPILRREAMNFRAEVTAAGHETWNSRSGEHDDLVIATALCVWGLGDDTTAYSGLMRWYAADAGEARGERYVVGVDLAQTVDFTAIAVMSRIDNPCLDDVRKPEFAAA